MYGTSKQCDLCKAHYTWLDGQFNKRNWKSWYTPVEIAMLLALNKTVYYSNWQNYVPTLDGILQADVMGRLPSFVSWPQSLQITITMSRTILHLVNPPVDQYIQKHPFKTEKINQMLTNGDPNLNYPLEDVNQFSVFRVLMVFEYILEHFLKLVFTNTPNLPHILHWSRIPTSMVKLLNNTAHVPWNSMVQYSWNQFAGHTHQPIDRPFLEQTLLQYYPTIRMNIIDWSIQFGTWIMSDDTELLRNIFLGYAPFSEKPLKAIAHPGSLFFDAISILFAFMYSIGPDSHKKNEAVLNTTFVTMYDAVLHNSELGTQQDPEAYHTYALNRSANNKGNSMEALALKLLDTCQFALIYFTAYIATNATYYGNPACHHCKPV
jgi:hypothetical protein